MTIQRRIYESRIQNLPEGLSSSSSGSIGGDSRTHSGGMASLSADTTNPITTGMKPGKGGKGKKDGLPTLQYWNARKGEFEERKDLVAWDVKAVVDSIDSSKEAITNLQTKFGGLEKNVEVYKIVYNKMTGDITNLLNKLDVGSSDPNRLKKTLDKTLDILRINRKEFDEYQNRAYDDEDDNNDIDIPDIPKDLPDWITPPWIPGKQINPWGLPKEYPEHPGGNICPTCTVPGHWIWIRGEWHWEAPYNDGGLESTVDVPFPNILLWKIIGFVVLDLPDLFPPEYDDDPTKGQHPPPKPKPVDPDPFPFPNAKPLDPNWKSGDGGQRSAPGGNPAQTSPKPKTRPTRKPGDFGYHRPTKRTPGQGFHGYGI